MTMNTSDNLMIDPSLILAKRTYANTILNINRLRMKNENIKFFMPQTFKTLLLEESDSILLEDNPLYSFYLHGATPISTRTLDHFRSDFSEVLVGYKAPSKLKKEYLILYESLREYMVYEYEYKNRYYDEQLFNILIEEWIFMQEKSWIVSRMKKPFNRIINAGALCMHFGEKSVEKMVKKTLKKEDSELISKVDTFRAFGKWIAVGGPSILSFFDPISSAVGGFVAGYFLLFDPK